MQREDGNAAGALDEDGGVGLEAGRSERVPRGDGGARERGGFFEAEVIGDAHEAGLLEEHVFGECAVDVTAESAFDLGGSGRAVVPVLKKTAADAVTGLPLDDAFTDGGDFAGAVGAGDAGKAEFGVVGALDHHQVAVIERNGVNSNKHLTGAGLRGGALYKLKRINAERGDLPDSHWGKSPGMVAAKFIGSMPSRYEYLQGPVE